MAYTGATRVAYPRPVYADHTEIPAGTAVYKQTVLEIIPVCDVTLWRMVKAGQFPPPSAYAGRRPLWSIDHVRAYVAGTWKATGKAA